MHTHTRTHVHTKFKQRKRAKSIKIADVWAGMACGVTLGLGHSVSKLEKKFAATHVKHWARYKAQCVCACVCVYLPLIMNKAIEHVVILVKSMDRLPCFRDACTVCPTNR